jgi:poly-gamma-glutamate synthesis protein (capsule biosynthesis protein)
MFTGDCVCGDLMQMAGEMPAGTFDFRESFAAIRATLAEADFCMGGLTTLVSPTSPYMLEQRSLDPRPKRSDANYNVSAAFLEALRGAGVDAVATAGNHNLDAGVRGVLETQTNLERYGLANVGFSPKKRSPRALVVNVNGIQVGILSYATAFNSWHYDYQQQLIDRYLSPYSPERVAADVAAARSQGAVFIFAYMNWGKLDKSATTSEQRTIAQALANAGVDYVIGTYPQVISQYTTVEAKDGRRVPVAYSLGNFISSRNSAKNNMNKNSIILCVELALTRERKLSVISNYIPIRIAPNHNKKKYVVLPCERARNGTEDSPKTQARIARAIGGEIGIRPIGK